MTARSYLFTALSILCIIFANASQGSPSDSPHTEIRQKVHEPRYHGVVIEFQEDNSTSFQARDDLHKKLRTHLKHRFSSDRLDAVVPDDRKKANDDDFLFNLCDEYKRNPLVQSCKPDPILHVYDTAQCSTDNSLDGFARDLGLVARKISDEKCELVPFMGKGNKPPFRLFDEKKTLTPLWAQEYIGSDLARDALDEMGNTAVVQVAAIDSGFGASMFTGKFAKDFVYFGQKEDEKSGPGHGLKTIEAMSGAPPFGIGARAEISVIANVVDDSGDRAAAEVIARAKPKVVNMSISRGTTRETSEALKRIAKGAILVGAAGNSYPYPIETNGLKDEMILVGNMRPNGMISANSQEGAEVTILAPADQHFQTPHGNYGGTSAGSPQVSGALSDVIAVLPELNRAEAKVLLQKTALPTANALQKPQMNGAGLLNVLKLVEVAKRFKEKGWPNNRDKLLANAALFEFKNESLKAFEKGKELLANNDSSCDARTKGFKLLRKAFLLDPDNTSARDALIQLYEKLGFTTNARFYRTFSHDGLVAEYEKSLRNDELGTIQANSAGRLSVTLGVDALRAIDKQLSDPDPWMRKKALEALEYFGKQGIPRLERFLREEKDWGNRAHVFASAWEMGVDGIDFLTKHFSDKDAFDACSGASKLAVWGPEVWRKIMTPKVPAKMRACMVHSLWLSCEKDWDECFHIIKTAASDPDKNIRIGAGDSILDLWRRGRSVYWIGDEGFKALQLSAEATNSIQDKKDIARLISEQKGPR